MSYISSKSNFLVPSNFTALSTYDFCDWLDHHIFRDTSLSPTGYDFVYPLTAYGGPLSAVSTIVFDATVSGGPLYEICYQDFCSRHTQLSSINLYCVSTVNFVLTALDETVSEIIKIIYDFGDKSQLVVNSYQFTNPIAPSPKDVIVSHDYYPTEKTITSYVATISVVYNNCCLNTYAATICSFRCGIYEMYDDVRLLDATQSKDSFNIVMTMESTERRQVFDTLLDLDEPLPYLSALPNAIVPIPQAERDTATRAPTGQRTRRNPVKPPPPFFIYLEGPGIDFTPDIPQLALKETFINLDSSGIILSGTGLAGDIGAPYTGGIGITIEAS